VDIKKNVQVQLDDMKKLIGFDAAHEPVSDDVEDADSEGDNDSLSSPPMDKESNQPMRHQ